MTCVPSTKKFCQCFDNCFSLICLRLVLLQMMDKLLQYEKGYSKLVDVATSGNPMHAATHTHAQYEKHFAPILLPAQIQSESAQLSYANYKATLTKYSKAHAALSVRHLLPLLPAYLPRSPMDFTQVTRQAKSSVDNTLFVYPIMLDRFKNRYVTRILSVACTATLSCCFVDQTLQLCILRDSFFNVLTTDDRTLNLFVIA